MRFKEISILRLLKKTVQAKSCLEAYSCTLGVVFVHGLEVMIFYKLKFQGGGFLSWYLIQEVGDALR
jgi:hypothetical protein